MFGDNKCVEGDLGVDGDERIRELNGEVSGDLDIFDWHKRFILSGSDLIKCGVFWFDYSIIIDNGRVNLTRKSPAGGGAEAQ